jgi:hypothetical protein
MLFSAFLYTFCKARLFWMLPRSLDCTASHLAVFRECPGHWRAVQSPHVAQSACRLIADSLQTHCDYCWSFLQFEYWFWNSRAARARSPILMSSSGPQPGSSKIGYLSSCYQFINPQFSNVLYVYQFCLWFLQELCTTIYHVFSCFNHVFLKFLENWHFNQVFIDSLAKHAISSIVHCLSIQNWWKSAVFLGVHHFCCWTLRLRNWWISRKLI